jgi:hypothetical protein
LMACRAVDEGRADKMFPIDWLASAYISLIGIFFLSAIAFYLGWRWRIPLLLVAMGIPAAWLSPDFLAVTGIPPEWLGPYPPTGGEYAGLGYFMVIGLSVTAMILGAPFGGASRLQPIATLKFVSVLCIVTCAAVAFVLWSQYVPSDCLGTSLRVRIGGRVLQLPPEMQPRVQRGSRSDFFGSIDHKFGYARLCRAGGNGTLAVDVDALSIRINLDEMADACNAGIPPAWCKSYFRSPDRGNFDVSIAPVSKADLPEHHWKFTRSVKEGDLKEGSVCLDSIVTRCSIWEPFDHDTRLIVSTSNLDKTFSNMPFAEAFEMTAKARETALAIISKQ